MKKLLEQYVETAVMTLKYKGDKIELENVYPSLLEGVIGNFTLYQVNGADCDYWADTDKYSISGCMKFGLAEITLKIGNERPKEIIETNKEEESQGPLILGIKDVAENILSELKTFYFTFGSGQRHEGYFQPIMAKESSVAHKKMCEIYGAQWAFMYDEEEWKNTSKDYFGKELKTIIAL